MAVKPKMDPNAVDQWVDDATHKAFEGIPEAVMGELSAQDREGLMNAINDGLAEAIKGFVDAD